MASPVITFSPAVDTYLTQAQTVTVEIADPDLNWYSLSIVATYADLARDECVVMTPGGGFSQNYASSSSHVVGSSLFIEITPTTRWPAAPYLTVLCIDSTPNYTVGEQNFFLNIPPVAPGGPANAPTIAFTSPAPASTIGPTDSITITITDVDQDWASVSIAATFPNLLRDELVFLGAFYGQGYTPSTMNQVGDDLVFVITPTVRWQDEPQLTVSVTDGQGNTVTDFANYSLSVPPVTPGMQAPQVSWTTTPSSQIRRNSPIVVEVDDNALALVVLSVRYPSGAQEVVYRQGAFASLYSASTAQVVGDVTTFTLVRRGGWFDDPTIQVDVCDFGGQVA